MDGDVIEMPCGRKIKKKIKKKKERKNRNAY
jgi:hypothetical protein